MASSIWRPGKLEAGSIKYSIQHWPSTAIDGGDFGACACSPAFATGAHIIGAYHRTSLMTGAAGCGDAALWRRRAMLVNAAIKNKLRSIQRSMTFDRCVCAPG
jgi:hypothetical protein